VTVLWGSVADWLPRAALCGAAFAVDGRSFLHMAASQPLVVGAVTGWALGDAGSGASAGALLQLAWLGGLPRGRKPGPDRSSGAVVAAVVAAQLPPLAGGGGTALAFLAGLAVGWLGSWVEVARRGVNERLSEWARKGLREGRRSALGWSQGAGVAVTAALGAATAGLGSAVSLGAAGALNNLLAGMDFRPAFALIACVGLARFFLGARGGGRPELVGFTAGAAAAALLGLKFAV